MVSSSTDEKSCSLWVMNQDYSSWTKKYNIGMALDESCYEFYRNYTSLAQSKGGKILLHNKDHMKIVSYDLEKTAFSDEDVHAISCSKVFEKLTLQESGFFFFFAPYNLFKIKLLNTTISGFLLRHILFLLRAQKALHVSTKSTSRV